MIIKQYEIYEPKKLFPVTVVSAETVKTDTEYKKAFFMINDKIVAIFNLEHITGFKVINALEIPVNEKAIDILEE